MRIHRKPVRTYASAIVLTLALAAPAWSATARPASAARPMSAAIDLSQVHITNFGQVDQVYYRGGQPKGHDYADLAALGVKAVINLTSDDADTHESQMARTAGLAYFQIPMTTHQVPTPMQIAQFLKIVDNPANQPVYVHCVGGKHRTGVMTAVYRLTHDAWTPDRAFKEMKHYKFGADFLHPEFKQFVFSYGAELARAAAASAAPAVTKGSTSPRHP